MFLLLMAIVCGGHAVATETAEPFIKISRRHDGRDTATLLATNNTLADITVFLNVKGTNFTASKNLPLKVVVPGKAEKYEILKLSKKDTGGRWRYNYNYEYGFGDASAQHDITYLYRLPYESGKSYRIAQSFGGKFSHQKGLHYGVDFAMPEGTPVCAAREGEVVAVRSSSDVGGPSARFKDKGNFVYILHPDRSLGVYLHFRKGGVTVAPGAQVKKGQIIGYSGNTGWSQGPHLHFSVHSVLREDEKGKSFPLRFSTSSGAKTYLLEGRSYTAD